MMARGGGGNGVGVGVAEGVDVVVGAGLTAPRVAAGVGAAEPHAERTAAATTVAARSGFIEKPYRRNLFQSVSTLERNADTNGYGLIPERAEALRLIAGTEALPQLAQEDRRAPSRGSGGDRGRAPNGGRRRLSRQGRHGVAAAGERHRVRRRSRPPSRLGSPR